MAFNPLKNRNVEAPIEQPNSPQNASQENQSYEDYDDLVQYDSYPTSENQSYAQMQTQPFKEDRKNMEFEGQKISDLEDSGIQTINLLKVASQNIIERPKFNIPLLETTPLAFVLESLGAKKIKETLYQIQEQEISIKENKWYNCTLKKGNVNAISLIKHITAIVENIDEKDNQKTLFISACKQLTKIQENAVNQDMVVDHETNGQEVKPVTISLPVQPKKEEFKYEPSEAIKLAQAKQYDQKIDWKALSEQLNNIPIDLVMEHIGANANEDGQRGKWKVWKTGHNVQVSGQKWNDWNTQTGGIGGISLLAYHICFDNNWNYRHEEDKKQARKLAIKELVKTFGTDYNISDLGSSINVSADYKEPFSMPHVIDFKIDAVKKYLHDKRGLPLWIINKQIKAGSLFAGFPSDWKEDKDIKNPEKFGDDKVWATFLAVNGNAAEMRAIQRTDNFAKLLAKGSDKDLGGFLLKAEKECNEKIVVSCEAAIDAMSYHAFYPGRIVMSCMGVNFNLAVKSAVECLDRGYKYQLAFDNDFAGNTAAISFKNRLMDELGEEEYNEHAKAGNISYFDLGIKCLIQTVKKGGTFYFDVKNNEEGRTAATLFQEQLGKVVPRETIKDLLAKGKIKYANIAPEYAMLQLQDINKEAQDAYNLLLSSKPFYLVLKQGDEEEKPEIKEKRESFESAFNRIAGNNLDNFIQEGKVIFKKQALAKDWNEFFGVMKRDPRFQERLEKLELEYAHYGEEIAPSKKKGKHP